MAVLPSKWWPSAEMYLRDDTGYFVWSGLLNTPQGFGVGSCQPLMPLLGPTQASTAELSASVVGHRWLHAFKFSPWNLNCEGFSQMFRFESPERSFHQERYSQTKGSESPGVSLCPWLWFDFVYGERTWPQAKAVRLSWQDFLLVTANKYITLYISFLRRA